MLDWLHYVKCPDNSKTKQANLTSSSSLYPINAESAAGKLRIPTFKFCSYVIRWGNRAQVTRLNEDLSCKAFAQEKQVIINLPAIEAVGFWSFSINMNLTPAFQWSVLILVLAYLFVNVFDAGLGDTDNEGVVSVFESRCYLLLPA